MAVRAALISALGLLLATGCSRSTLGRGDTDEPVPRNGDSRDGDLVTPGDRVQGDPRQDDGAAVGDPFIPDGGDHERAGDPPGDTDLAGDAGDAGGDEALAGDRSAECEAAAQVLATEVYASNQECTVVVRVEFLSLEILGYQVFCGPPATVTAQDAFIVVEEQMPELFNHNDSPAFYNPPEPNDAYFLVASASPVEAGWTAVVSARTGLPLFGGVWYVEETPNSITYPTTWRDPEELGLECTVDYPLPNTTCNNRGVPRSCDDLVLVSPTEENTMSASLAAVFTTSLGPAFDTSGRIHDANVLLFERTHYPLETAQSLVDAIVFIHGGPL